MGRFINPPVRATRPCTGFQTGDTKNERTVCSCDDSLERSGARLQGRYTTDRGPPRCQSNILTRSSKWRLLPDCFWGLVPCVGNREREIAAGRDALWICRRRRRRSTLERVLLFPAVTVLRQKYLCAAFATDASVHNGGERSPLGLDDSAVSSLSSSEDLDLFRMTLPTQIASAAAGSSPRFRTPSVRHRQRHLLSAIDLGQGGVRATEAEICGSGRMELNR